MHYNKNSKGGSYLRGGDSPCKSKGKTLIKLFIWGFVLALMAAIAVGDVGQGVVEASPNEGVEPAVIDVGGNEDISADKTRQTIGFVENMSIRKALGVLAVRYKKNIVPSPSVDGVLAFTRLYDVTFKEALDAILGASLKYEQKGNLIKVYTSGEYKKLREDKGRMIHKVFTLYYVSAAEAIKLLSPLLSSAGVIQGSSPAETIVPTGESISSGSSGGDNMALNDTIVVVDYPENVAEIEKSLKELDVRPMQVLVEATILSATLTEGMKFGVDLNLLGGVSLNGTEASAADAYNSAVSAQTPMGQIGAGVATGTPIETSGFATAGGSGLRIGITSGDVAAFITALEEVTDTTILANPKILAVNKQLGQVYIGNKIGYVSQTTQTQTSTTQQVEFLETGTKLSFRPYIGNDGYIRMDIQPKDSSGTLKSNNIPDESSTELATNIMVKDGQTIVIGGLFRDVVVTSRSQVPLLGDLPLVGGVFRGTSDSTTRQEVIVLLTPHIITEPSQTHGQARAADISRKRFGAKEALQWEGRAKLAEEHYTKAAKYYLDGDYKAAMKELKESLKVRPTYLEAIRLKEKIINKTQPKKAKAEIKRKMLNIVEQDDLDKWLRL